MVEKIISLKFGIIFLFLIFLVLAGSQSAIGQSPQQPIRLPGEILYCSHEEFYGTDSVRSADYWIFRSHDESIVLAYILEREAQINVCSSILIDQPRRVIYHNEGDITRYINLEGKLLEDMVCLAAIEGEENTGEVRTSYSNIRYNMQDIASTTEVDLIYPTHLLLAPVYIGEFPLLGQTELQPYEGRGFSLEIPFSQLEDVGISTENNRFEQANIDEIVRFYQTELTDWELTPINKTSYPDNPHIIVGSRSMYLSFWNPATEAIILMEFHITRDAHLRVLVTIPPSARSSDIRRPGDIIEGSSLSAAAKSNLFIGWAELGVEYLFNPNQIESYALQNANHYWFVDLQIQGNAYQVIRSRTVTQTHCDPQNFLPEWATQP